jgi:hypothetical protein
MRVCRRSLDDGPSDGGWLAAARSQPAAVTPFPKFGPEPSPKQTAFAAMYSGRGPPRTPRKKAAMELAGDLVED